MRYHKKCALILGLSLCCLVTSSVPALAQVTLDRRDNQEPWLYHITADPAGEASPALRYQLIQGSRGRRKGNAATHYYRALMLFDEQERAKKELPKLMGTVEKFGTDSQQLTNLPADDVRKFLLECGPIINELELASECDSCDWGIDVLSLSTQESIELRLPEIQNSRILAYVLVLKSLLAIVDRKYDEAFHSIHLGCQLGKDITKFPTFVSSLVGTAIVVSATTPLIELSAEPNAPNFYWALASAPKPYVDLKPALEYEAGWAMKLPLISEAEQSHTPEEWKRLLAEAFQFKQQMEGTSSLKSQDGSDSNTQFDILQHLMGEYPRAKQELTLLGFTPDQVESMPVSQVIALHDARLIRLKSDELLCMIHQPYARAAEISARLDTLPPRPPSNPKRLSDLQESLGLFERLRPPIGQVLQATTRLDRRLVRIQVVEALRIHGAVNGGKLPATLSDVTLVPIPDDPITGKPIIYRLEGETAVLEFPPPEPYKFITYGETIRLTLRNVP